MNPKDLRPNPQDVRVMRGSAFEYEYALEGDDGAPVDIGGLELEGAMRRLGADVDAAAFEFDREDDENGTGVLRVLGFSDLPTGAYAYWVRTKDTDGIPEYVGRGVIRIYSENKP